jgi:hypothetical protein
MASRAAKVRIVTLSTGEEAPRTNDVCNVRNNNSRSNSGFVLFTVIWLVAAIAVLTTTFVTRLQNAKILERALSFNRELEMAADGLTRLKAFRLAQQTLLPSANPLNVRGELNSCFWNETLQLTFSIQDQGGLIDINTGSPELMTTLFIGLGFKSNETSQILDAILDYRDPDTTTKSGRSEQELFPETEPGASNQPFVAIEELDRVPGIPDEAFQKLLRVTTVHSQQQGVDPSSAPVALQKLIEGPTGKLQDSFLSPSSKRVYTITVKAVRKGGGHFTRHAIIAVTGQPYQPFVILKWAKRDRDFLGEAKPPTRSCFKIDP